MRDEVCAVGVHSAPAVAKERRVGSPASAGYERILASSKLAQSAEDLVFEGR